MTKRVIHDLFLLCLNAASGLIENGFIQLCTKILCKIQDINLYSGLGSNYPVFVSLFHGGNMVLLPKLISHLNKNK